jgi:hypothetical protein
MDYTVYTAVKNQFTANPNLCDLFKLLSIETWKRIEYSYSRARVKVFETTITQNLIFSINAYKDQFGLDIEILEAIIKVIGVDARYPHRKITLSFTYLMAEQVKDLEVIKIWIKQ